MSATASRGVVRRLTESSTGFDAVDLENAVIRGVKVLGTKSKNGRRYLESAIREAVPLYEGAKVYLDHMRDSQKERANTERWGKLSDVHQVEDGGLVGDLHYLKSHPATEQILEALTRFNDFGLSQDADGVIREQDGEACVVSIEKIYSIDVVQRPATTSNLFESEQTMKVKLIESLKQHESHPIAGLLLERLTEMQDEFAEGMGFNLDEMQYDIESEMADDESYAIKMAFEAAMMAVLKNESMEVDAKIDRIRKLLAAKEEISSDDSSDNESDQDTSEGYSMEESELRESIDRLTEELRASKAEASRLAAEKECRKLLEQHNREVTDVRLKALIAFDDKGRKELVESWPKIEASDAGKPKRSPSRVLESSDDLPQSAEDFRKKLGV